MTNRSEIGSAIAMSRVPTSARSDEPDAVSRVGESRSGLLDVGRVRVVPEVLELDAETLDRAIAPREEADDLVDLDDALVAESGVAQGHDIGPRGGGPTRPIAGACE